jgi:phosphoenolpyruvate carboxylase
LFAWQQRSLLPTWAGAAVALVSGLDRRDRERKERSEKAALRTEPATTITI